MVGVDNPHGTIEEADGWLGGLIKQTVPQHCYAVVEEFVTELTTTHIVASLAREAGGPSYSVPALASALWRIGVPARVRYILDTEVELKDVLEGRSCGHLARSGPLGRFLRSSPSLARAIERDAQAGAILHTHGLWLAPNIYPARTKRRARARVKIVHSPRGMLGTAALAISAYKKKLCWLIAQRAALSLADCIHATAFSEYHEIRGAGLSNPVAVIPNGIDLPDLGWAPRVRNEDNVVLSLGRIHPKKGLDRLLQAWVGVEREFPKWRLRIVGPSEIDHDQQLRALAIELGLQRVSIEGPIYGAEKTAAMRGADLFVLSTLNENFGLTVAESLAVETPVISTKGAPWAGLESERCGWWIDQGVEPLRFALRTAIEAPHEQRIEMGKRGRSWMAREFGWDRVAAEMCDVYRWLREGGDLPSTVQIA
jgi:glycosyltransferase involved in cell wall biosynthesis